jgi:thymidylate synthase
MIHTAPEKLEDIEKGAGGAPEVKEYVPWKINTKEEEDISDIENKIENAEEWNQWSDSNKNQEKKSEKQNTVLDWFSKQVEKFSTNNPDKINRIPAAKNIVKDLQESQKWNPLGKAFQWVSNKILWENNQ